MPDWLESNLPRREIVLDCNISKPDFVIIQRVIQNRIFNGIMVAEFCVVGTTFTMNGGAISDNTASWGGSGVCVATKSKFIMTGGTISGNTTAGKGGGVSVSEDATFTIDGKVDICGNNKTSDNSANNLNLSKDETITIGSNFDASSKIGVNTETTPYCNKLVDVAAATTDISKVFTADIDGQSIVYNDGKVQLKGAHNTTHTEANAPTCTAKGNKEYWYCSACKKYFSDSECTTETSLADAGIAATGHSWGEWQTTTPATCTQAGAK